MGDEIAGIGKGPRASLIEENQFKFIFGHSEIMALRELTLN